MRLRIALACLLATGIVRFWLTPLHSSFWVDEMVTAFIVHHGPADPSLAVAPQVTETIYPWLPRISEKLFGFSEIAYRVPSLLALGIALWLIWLLGNRLICPGAGWFAIFGCLSLKGFNYQAADARPYALGTCVAAAGLWFLVRWLDSGRWRDAWVFALFAALLWRVHLIFWPFYAIFAGYALIRLLRHETSVTWSKALAIFAVVAVTLIPVALEALRLLHDAKSHVIVKAPVLRDLRRTLKFGLVLPCAAGAFLLQRVFKWKRQIAMPGLGAWVLILGWWLWHPMALFAFSKLTGASVYVDRYLSLALPGAALAATLGAAYFIPARWWRPLSAVFAIIILYFTGHWHVLFPAHHNSNWRAAAQAINRWSDGGSTPVLCPSPFVEARSPIWRPDYPLPGFLYSYLDTYRIAARPYLLPFEDSPEAEFYAGALARGLLSRTSHFLVYGGDRNVLYWRHWLAGRPELAGWHSRLLGPFGDVEVALFENPRPELASR